MSRVLEDRVALIKAISDAAVQETVLAREVADRVNTIVEFIEKDKQGHLLSTSKEVDCAISYDPKGGKSETRRTRTSLGRYIRSHIYPDPHDFSEASLQRLTNFVNGRLAPVDEDRFKIITGQAVVDAYEGECGVHSCMTGGGGLSKLVQFYAENPQTVGLLLCRTDGANNGYARALFWTTNEGKKVVDRIYPNDGAHVRMIRDWATKNGHIWRANNSPPGSSPVPLCDRGVYTVTMNASKVGLTPYLDTFCWGDLEKKTGIWTLSNATGDYEWDLRTGEGLARQVQPCFARCEQCNGKIMSREHVAAFGGRTLCQACADEVSVPCEHCRNRFSNKEKDTRVRIRVDRAGADRTQKWCEPCVARNAVVCLGCGNRYAAGAALRAVNGGHACDKCVELCKSCGDYALKAKMVDGLCNPCAVAADADRAWAARLRR